MILKKLEQLDNGDVIAFKGSGIFSRYVRKFTKSPFTHVAIVINIKCDGLDKEIPCIVESHSTAGYRLRNINTFSKPYWVFKTNAKWNKQAAEIALKNIGTYKYAWINIFLAVIGMKMITVGDHLVCHQFAARILNFCGVKVGNPKSPQELLDRLGK